MEQMAPKATSPPATDKHEGEEEAPSLMQICPFLSRASAELIRCTECDEEFHDLGGIYTHLQKRHAEQFQRLRERTDAADAQKGALHARQRRKNSADLLLYGPQSAQLLFGPQQPSPKADSAWFASASSVWALGLYERRHFRNGTIGALCLECGHVVWDLTEDEAAPETADAGGELRAHMQLKHPQYASGNYAAGGGAQNAAAGASGSASATLLFATENQPAEAPTWTSQQQSFVENFGANPPAGQSASVSAVNAAPAPRPANQTHVDEFGQLWLWLDACDNDTDALSNACARHAAYPSQKFVPGGTEKVLLSCAYDPALCTFSAMWLRAQRAIYQSLGHNHPMLPEVLKTRYSVKEEEVQHHLPLQQNENNMVLDTSSGSAMMESIERVLHDRAAVHVDSTGRRWEWFADVPTEADLRAVCRTHGLYREAGARTFSCKWSSRNARSKYHCSFRALYVPQRAALFHRQPHNHPMQVGKGGAHAAQLLLSRAVYVDRMGKEWIWLADVYNKADLERACRARNLARQGPRNVPGKAYFCCQRAKGSKTKCPYRGLYVQKRHALFHRLVHNHPITTGSGRYTVPGQRRPAANNTAANRANTNCAVQSQADSIADIAKSIQAYEAKRELEQQQQQQTSFNGFPQQNSTAPTTAPATNPSGQIGMETSASAESSSTQQQQQPMFGGLDSFLFGNVA